MTIKEKLGELSLKEREILDKVVSPIYFGDNSDHIQGLWGVVSFVMGETVQEEVDIDVLFGLLKEE